MKIIALLPFKNEAHILPTYLHSVEQIVDEIIALDDHSFDESIQILEQAGATVLPSPFPADEPVHMSKRRQLLLEAGRARDGTHFIWLDADETFSADFITGAREHIERLQPGETLHLRWVHIWKDVHHYLDDARSPFGRLWKDFIMCDDGVSSFEDRFLSESRTPASSAVRTEVDERDGVVLHFQFSDLVSVQWKQAWYRCTELIEGSRSARRINRTYRITLDDPTLFSRPIPPVWKSGTPLPTLGTATWHAKEIYDLFEIHGIEFFEPLQIWHIPELYKHFVKTVGRSPRTKVFPIWVEKIADIKNILTSYSN